MAKLAPKGSEIEYTIGSHFLSAIINGDDSGLDDNEIEVLNSFMETLGNGLFTTAEEESYNEFGTCDITGLRGHVTDMVFIPYINNEIEVLPDTPSHLGFRARVLYRSALLRGQVKRAAHERGDDTDKVFIPYIND